MALTIQQREDRNNLFAKGMKRCPKCKDEKKLDEFGIRAGTYTGRKSYCISCVSKYQEKARKERMVKSGKLALRDKLEQRRILLLKHQMKMCPSCMKDLPLEDFYHTETGDYNSWCKECVLNERKRNRHSPGKIKQSILLDSMGLAFCSRCHKLMSIEDKFYPQESTGYRYYCKECCKIIQLYRLKGMHPKVVREELVKLGLMECRDCGDIIPDEDSHHPYWCSRCERGYHRARASKDKNCNRRNRSLVAMGVKLCSKCKTVLPISLFLRKKNLLVGYRSNCKKCDSINGRPLSRLSIEDQLNAFNIAVCACGTADYKKNMSMGEKGEYYCKECTKKNEYKKMTLAQKRQKRRDELFKRGLRLCERCYEISELSNFHKNKNYPNEKNIYCKSCDKDGVNRCRGSYKLIEARELLKYELRKCCACFNTKPLSEFPLDAYFANSGHGHICLECSKKNAKAKRRKKQSDLSVSALREYARKHIGDPGDKYIDYLIPNARIGIAQEPDYFCVIDGKLFLLKVDFIRYVEEKYGIVKKAVRSRLDTGATAEQAILSKKEYSRVRKEERRERENI